MVVARCAECGADLAGLGADCPACADGAAKDEIECASVEIGLVTDLPPEECATGPLWVRISAASVYGVVGVFCGFGSAMFFLEQQLVLSDVFFGFMALGLFVIAVFGVKESLFPSDWRPE